MRLERFDPARNMARTCELRFARSLFGGAALLRRWGRFGARGGAQRIDLFAASAEAARAYRRLAAAKKRKGYAPARRG